MHGKELFNVRNIESAEVDVCPAAAVAVPFAQHQRRSGRGKSFLRSGANVCIAT
jgi:hypothetical protein